LKIKGFRLKREKHGFYQRNRAFMARCTKKDILLYRFSGQESA